jgi:hypothetical protein
MQEAISAILFTTPARAAWEMRYVRKNTKRSIDPFQSALDRTRASGSRQSRHRAPRRYFNLHWIERVRAGQFWLP